MNSPETIAAIASINENEIQHVYSGRPGCCCGCRGTHSYNPAFIKEQSERRGYEVTLDECSMTRIRNVVRKIKENAAECEVNTQYSHYVSFETETRLYIVYTKEN